MHIVILTIGTRGDVQPNVAFGKGLMEAGHKVSLATHQVFENFVLENGIEFRKLEGNPKEIMEKSDIKRMGGSTTKNVRWMMEKLNEELKPILKNIESVCSDADVIIYNVFSYPALYMAEKLRVPIILAALQPCIPSREFSNATGKPLPIWLPFKGTINKLSSTIPSNIFFQTFRKGINEWRRDALGLKAISVKTLSKLVKDVSVPVINAFSSHLVPKPKDWPAHHFISGYWFLERDQNWRPQSDLVSFIDDGDKPIYIGFGSMTENESKKLSEIVREAVKISKKRAIVYSGWSDLESDINSDIYYLEGAPHDWLFPQMAAVIHHGGAGTTAVGLKAGVPNFIVPFFADQPFWGDRVYKMGIGPKPIEAKNLDAEKLAKGIIEACSNSEFKKNAKAIANKINQEDGIKEGIKNLEKIVLEWDNQKMWNY